MEVKVFCYNVLAPNLCKPQDFIKSDAKHINAETRFKAILKLLRKAVEDEAVICLQEVTERWAGRFLAFFDENDYYMVTSNYNVRPFTGHMGIATAFPRKRFKMTECKFVRPSRVSLGRDFYKNKNKWSKFDVLPSMWTPQFWKGAAVACGATALSLLVPNGMLTRATVTTLVCATATTILGNTMREPSSWAAKQANKTLEERLRDFHNVLVQVKLYDREKKTAFCVANYHMPCRFDDEEIMVALAALARKKVASLAKKSPVVFCGDFNSTPETPSYQTLVMDGKSDVPTKYVSMKIDKRTMFPLQVPNMRSAFADKMGKEPEFTNYARRLFRGKLIEFIDCLDYIFISDHFQVIDVSETPTKEETVSNSESYPDGNQPSDHIPITATLKIKGKL